MSDTRSYTVKAWTLSGFYQPVDMNVTNTIKAGSTVPLKFEAFAGTQELTALATVGSFKVGQITCGSTSAVTDDIELYTSGATTLRYDSTGGQFIQNWQVPKVSANTCYRVTLTLADGTFATATFKTK
ncbi:MAG: PxKF domain-containing protein [Actinomycetota bacterium]|nr:PxKF domain-containing protein [Actinomycetota bacterium]